MGDYIRWATPVPRGRRGLGEVGAVPRPQPRQALDPAEPQGGARARGAAEAGARARRAARVVPPGRARPARRGLRAPARGEPGARVLRDHRATGRTAPTRTRSGHDMNYLGLGGLLGLTRRARRTAGAGRRADRRHRRRRADGGVRHPRRAARARAHRARASSWTSRCSTARCPGSPSWPRATSPRTWCRSAARSSSRAALICYRPYACKDGWVTLGALEPKFWQAWCAGVGREDLVEKQFDAPGSDAHAEVERIFMERTREEWREFASNHDCCLEPVLDLDEALDSELVRAREMVVEVDQPGADGVRLLGVPVKLSRTPGAPAGPGPALGEHTHEVLAALGYDEERDRGAGGGGRGGRAPPGTGRPRELHGVSAERAPEDEGAGRAQRRQLRHDQALPARGAAAGAGQDLAQHGLLPARVRRADPAHQAAPGGALHAAQADPLGARGRPRARARRSWSSRTGSSRARSRGTRSRVSAAELRRRYDIPQEVLDRLAELEILTPDQPRLRRARRADRGGHQPLPRRRLRRAHRLHRLRHACATSARSRTS